MPSAEAFAPCCLTVAGSDSGGNAGVQADLRAFHAYGVHGCTVFTALTAQNPGGVYGVLDVPPGFVGRQLDAVFGAYAVRAIKTGMFSSAGAAEALAERLGAMDARPPLVVDPVMVATCGASLAGDEVKRTILGRLLPFAALITPNIPEAEAICGAAGSQEDLAKRIYETYGTPALVKGGHAAGCGEMADCLCDADGIHVYSAPAVVNPASTHGTGCSLAAAIAAAMALGMPLRAAVASAKAYVRAAIAASHSVGPRAAVLGFAVPAEL